MNKQELNSLHPESLLENSNQVVKSLEELQTEFNNLRAKDDDFARDYARHEFVNWLNDNEWHAVD